MILFKTFLTIVESGSLVGASQMLNVTQSTVTARLKALEEDLGQQLLHRRKNGIQLTSAGEKFKRYAEAMENMWRLARLETSLPEGMESICHLGCEVDLWPMTGRKLAAAVRERFDKTALSVRPLDQSQMNTWLKSGLIDAAISYAPSNSNDAVSVEIGSENLILYTTDPEGPLTYNPDYVYVDAGERFGREHTEAFADADVARNSFGCAVWAMDHIVDHGGSAYLPEKLAVTKLATGEIHRVTDAPTFSRTAYLVYQQAKMDAWPWLPDLLMELGP